MIRRQQYLSHLAQFLDKPLIKVLTGMRRVEKSTLMRIVKEDLLAQEITPKRILFVDNESLDFDDIRDYRELNAWVQERKPRGKHNAYMFIDEVQEIVEWEWAVLSLHGEGWVDIPQVSS